jgi:uncharacterized membrane protein
MADANRLAAEIERLNAFERRVIDRFIHRDRTTPQPSETESLGDRLADRVTAFGGSWPFIFLTMLAIGTWMVINAAMSKAFDPYPYILLNLVLAVLTVLQAPLIMMSQNRQASRDRQDQQHDYEVNTKAELEIAALQARLDQVQSGEWVELMKIQQQQLELLNQLASRLPRV